jgi:hypothetical protein
VTFLLASSRRREVRVNDQPPAAAVLQDQADARRHGHLLSPARTLKEPSIAAQATGPAPEIELQSNDSDRLSLCAPSRSTCARICSGPIRFSSAPVP